MNGDSAIARCGNEVDGRVSVKALSAVFEESQARDAAFVVLLALADWADHGGRCWPSYRQIACKARVSRRTAIDAIQHLVQLGELALIPRGHQPGRFDDEAPRPSRVQRRNLYQILLMKPRGEVGHVLHQQPRELGQLSHYLGVTPWPREAPPVVQSSHPEGATAAPSMVQLAQPEGATDDTQMVQSATLHIRNKPSGDPLGDPSGTPLKVPSVQTSAGAAPRPRPDPAGTPTENVGVIIKLAHLVMDLIGVASPDLPEALKAACAREHLAYDSEAVGKAIEAARWQRHAQSTDGLRG